MRTVRTTFEEVRRRVEKTVPCKGCGKKLKRATTLFQTLNPYNKTAAGTVKTRSEIVAELNQEAGRWEPDYPYCPRCEP